MPPVGRFPAAAARRSPHRPGRCRFTPTCGAYGLTAVERHGLTVGDRMAAERVRPPGYRAAPTTRCADRRRPA
ncbi:membrane protein insertion efficiency factor YidD [Micromonospora sp. CPCC 205561]|uniref:membrane protein insertion efficiency factor YidD n=1 Tax=Micromonospora sp. CPCC 205561 TaxID=3122407 RepID=UPI003FA5C29A